ncbi:class I SAM-dependent methyltransferase [Patescibacteria group bacterium]|nr:class I SAM-dependent methyltransferase [Patescibacteria group bacterium]
MICRMCKSASLHQFLDLGFTPPADQFRRREQLCEPDIYYPLEVMLCTNCGLSQLSYVVSEEILYRHDYPYESSTTKTGQSHWKEFAASATKLLTLNSSDLVVDVGSNVGVLLESFRSNGTRILGVDPASNIVRIAEKRGIETLCEFFSMDVVERILADKGHATVVTGTNVFAHVDDLDSFILAVDKLLNERGVLIIEAPYFLKLVENFEYDTIYHEHLSYLSVKPLVRFFARFDMEIFEIQQKDIHGGSFRLFVNRVGRRFVSPVVDKLLKVEEEKGIHTLKVLNKFSEDVQKNREDFLWMLRQLKHEGKQIVGISAPAKGMTLLNYCRIGTETLDFVTEKSGLKIGRFTPGAHIPVVADEELIRQVPDYGLLLAWNFADEIMTNLKSYREKGGKFIIPIPTPRIIE